MRHQDAGRALVGRVREGGALIGHLDYFMPGLPRTVADGDDPTCEQQMALDIVCRAKAIAGVEVDG